MFICRVCERLVLMHPLFVNGEALTHMCEPCAYHAGKPEAPHIDEVCTTACADLHIEGMYAAGEYKSVRAKYLAAFSWLREKRVKLYCKGRRLKKNPPPFKPDDGKGGWRDSDGEEDWKGDTE